MVELVKYMVNELVDDKDSVVVTESGGVISISVAKNDMGKIIGRQGRIAKAIRSIVKAASIKSGTKYTVDILEADGEAEVSAEVPAESDTDRDIESGDDETAAEAAVEE